MPQINMKGFLPLMMAVLTAVAVGCSESNKEADIDSDTGRHPSTWLAEHSAEYKANSGGCKECHGEDYRGGTSSVSCFSKSFNGAACHALGPFGHPAGWTAAGGHDAAAKQDYTQCSVCHGNDFKGGISGVSCYSASYNGMTCHAIGPFGHPAGWSASGFHGIAARADLTECRTCHANPNTGGAGSNPRFNVSIDSYVNGCESCHPQNTAHPVPWQGMAANHRAAGNQAAACALCHGANLSGGAGPACSTCHANGSPLTAFGCASCHGNPPSGAASPNRAGTHGVHGTFSTTTSLCDACHTGGGSGTNAHNNGSVNVAFSSAYNAKSGTASFNANGTCSKVSCHGGQTTPAWLSGTTIDVNSQCDVCHAFGASEYNSYYSGKHEIHLSYNIGCTTCHDTTKLATVHFTKLNTSAMEGPASGTLKSELNYTGTTCATVCHSAQSWK